MQLPLNRSRFQMHLSTAVLLMFIAAGIVWLNVRDRGTNNDLYDERYGWPIVAVRIDEYIELPHGSGGEQYQPLPAKIDFLSASVDIGVALLILIPVWQLCEWQIRRRSAS